MRRLLLISNSASPGESYLEKAGPDLNDFLTEADREEVILVPYAAITYSYDEYVSKVNKALEPFGIKVHGLHTYDDPVAAIKQATAILVGGGNTWVLTATMQRLGLMEPICEAVSRGIPYSGWSAGSNVACPTLMTTNDMPIAEPERFRTLGLIPFQINPHYLDKAPEGHGGETRDFRIIEFITQNPDIFVAGLREGSRFLIQGDEIEVHGENNVRIYHGGEETQEMMPTGDFSFLLEEPSREEEK